MVTFRLVSTSLEGIAFERQRYLTYFPVQGYATAFDPKPSWDPKNEFYVLYGRRYSSCS